MLALFLSSLALAPQIANEKLNPPLAVSIVGTVDDTRVLTTSDGSIAIYAAQQDRPGVLELYAVPTDRSSSSWKLSGPMTNRGNVWTSFEGFKLSPDETRVVYLADQDVDQVLELYSVPLDGSAPPVKLNPPISFGGSVYAATWSIAPDGNLVVYSARTSVNDDLAVYSAPIDGSAAPTKLSGEFPVGSSVGAWGVVVSPDSSRVVYIGIENAPEIDLFSVPIDGSAPRVQLDAFHSSGRILRNVRVSPDSTTVVFDHPAATLTGIATFAVPIDGSTLPVSLSAATTVSTCNSRVITPDSSRVVFEQYDNAARETTLFSAPIDASAAPTQLSSFAGSIFGTELTPDGKTVVFIGPDSTGRSALYAAPVDGSGPTVRVGANVPHRVYRFEVHPDSERVAFAGFDATSKLPSIFTATLDGSAPTIEVAGFGIEVIADFHVAPLDDRVVYAVANTLWSVPFDGNALATRLDDALGLFSVRLLDVAGDGRPVYATDDEIELTRELFVVAADGSSKATKLNDTLALALTREPVEAVHPAPDGTTVVYSARQDSARITELYAVPDEGGASVKLNGPALTETHVGPYVRFSPDGTRVAYVANHADKATQQLFVTRTNGASLPIQLSTAFGASGVPFQPDAFAFSPDGSRLVYLSAQGSTGDVKLYSVLADGSAAPTRLVPPMPSGGDVLDFRITSDGEYVVYRAEQNSSKTAELFRVPIEGGAFVRLNEDDDLRVQDDWVLDPTERFVVYRNGRTRIEVRSAPIDGSASPATLNPPLAIPGGDVEGFVVTPDGATVLFVAAVADTSQLDLFARAIDGSGNAVEVSALPGANRSVRLGMLPTPDSTHVVYAANQDAYDIVELYLAPIDASTPPRKLNGRLPQLSRVDAWAIDPTGSVVVFRADDRVVGRRELFAVRMNGAMKPRRLHDPLPLGGDVDGPMLFTENGKHVLFTMDPGATIRNTNLYAARLDGPGRPVQINQPLAAPYDSVRWFGLSSDGEHVLHLAAQDEPGAIELYASRAPAPVVPKK